MQILNLSFLKICIAWFSSILSYGVDVPDSVFCDNHSMNWVPLKIGGPRLQPC